MDDARGVRMRETFHRLDEPIHRLRHEQWPALFEQLREIFAVEELHREERRLAVHADVHHANDVIALQARAVARPSWMNPRDGLFVLRDRGEEASFNAISCESIFLCFAA